ncbi:MAG TPA: VIT domain-containing protein [Bacteroidales bacterium]|nr:VIT domain-containing protein [Bacteroidales bacterium]
MKTIDNSIKMNRIALVLAIFFLACGNTFCQVEENENDKTLSPYFFVQSDGAEIDQLPLRSTSAEVNIAGIIADVKVTQEYKNDGKSAIEAIYVFPASTRAAVYKMTMTIGERTINAVIKERNQARQEYEEARQQGKSASLLEQQRPNVFQMNVANIMPGDLVKVELCYTELLIPENGVYEFVYPTVVGPRYSNKIEYVASQNDKWVSNPYTKEGEKSMAKFNIRVNLNAGMPVNDVRCGTHETDITYAAKDRASIMLKPANEYEGNRDFILQYRLKGDAIQQGLLLYKGKNENFFLAMVQPPKRIQPEQIPPREYVFIVDVSGSMSGFSLDISKNILRDLIGKLKSTDRYNVILFAGASNLMHAQSVPANQTNIKEAINFIDRQEGGGGTELLSALQKALSLKGTEDYSRTFVILTDGYVDIEKESFDLVRKNLGKANFFAFGIGSSVNRYLIEGLAHVGAGEPFIAENPERAAVVAQQFRKYIESPVLTNISVQYTGFDAYDIEPVTIPDLFAERPLIIYGKWRGNATGSITIKGTTGNKDYNQVLKVNASDVSDKNAALTYLWARKRIQMLDDYSKAGDNGTEKQVTALGLKYNLLTAYTSFIAVDSEVRNTTGQSTTVKQPLPLPEGVSNYAVGNSGYASSVKRSAAPMMKSAEYSFEEEKVKVDDAIESINCVDDREDTLVDSNKIYATVDVMPIFDGKNIQAFQAYVKKHFAYPASLKGPKMKGRVFVQFVVDETGKVVDAKIGRGLQVEIDKEILRIINNSPLWTPGMHKGRTAKVRLILPFDV